MIIKEFRELRRDRRTLGMMIVMPLLLLVVFGYAANFYVSHVTTAIIGPQAAAAASMLRCAGFISSSSSLTCAGFSAIFSPPMGCL